MKWALLCVALVACAGCGGTSSLYWVHATADEAQFKRDNYECVRDSRIIAPADPCRDAVTCYAGGAAQRQTDDLYDRCMGSKGWVKEQRP